MKILSLLGICVLLFAPVRARAQLVVSVSPAIISGQKAIVRLQLTNGLPETVESVRATAFLLNGQGKVVGQMSRWIIDGTGTNGLPSGATNVLSLVMSASGSHDLTAKILVNRIVLEGGKLGDVNKDVTVRSAADQ